MPKQIDILFLPEFEESMISGKKTATTRTRRHGRPGDWFVRFGRTFVLASIQRIYLDIAVRYRYLEEGFSSSSEFVKYWNKLHPRVPYAQRPNRIVYHHIFTLEQEQ